MLFNKSKDSDVDFAVVLTEQGFSFTQYKDIVMDWTLSNIIYNIGKEYQLVPKNDHLKVLPSEF